MLPPPEPARRQIVLFDHLGGQKIRRINRIGFALGAIALAPLGWAAVQTMQNQIDIGPPAIVVLMTLLSFALVLLATSLQLSRRFVTRLEAWPQSHLLLIRTAGIWQERIALANLGDFDLHGLGSLAAGSDSPTPGSYHRIACGRRRRLWLDLAGATSIAPPELWNRLQPATEYSRPFRR